MPPALSPSRAGDFKICPLRYRYTVVDRLPQESSAAALRGTIIHAVLEKLMALPPADRTWQACENLAEEVVSPLQPDEVALISADDGLGLIADALFRYGSLEDPRTVPCAETELRFDTVTPGGTPIRGFIDRVDRRPDGAIRLVDYKSGKLPKEQYAAKALFQMKLYALAWWLTHGEVPQRLQLYYLAGDGGTLTYDVESVGELEVFARILDAMWATILRLGETGDFRPRENPLCDWCPFQQHCPAKGGTLLPYPGWPGTESSPAGQGD